MYEEDLNALEDLLRRLKVEYDIYFNGNRKRAPDELKGRVEKLIKKLSQAAAMTFSERFLFNTLIARYYLYRDVWRRMTTKQESGIEKEAQTLADKAVPGAETPAQSNAAEQFQICIDNAESDSEKIRELYDALMRLSGKCAQEAPKISFERFSSYVAAQAQSIRQKYNCHRVIFTLALEEDAIKFRAAATDSHQVEPESP